MNGIIKPWNHLEEWNAGILGTENILSLILLASFHRSIEVSSLEV